MNEVNNWLMHLRGDFRAGFRPTSTTSPFGVCEIVYVTDPEDESGTVFADVQVNLDGALGVVEGDTYGALTAIRIPLP